MTRSAATAEEAPLPGKFRGPGDADKAGDAGEGEMGAGEAGGGDAAAASQGQEGV